MNRLSLLAASLLTFASLVAQEAPVDHLLGNPNAPAAEDPVRNPRSGDTAERGPRGPSEERRRAFVRERVEGVRDSGITRDEMRTLRAALEAVGQDETVRAARAEAEQARQAVREALQAYAKSKGLPTPGEPPADGTKPERPTPERMNAIRKAMEGARNDPAVKAAFEQGKEVGKKLREAVRAALLRKDPSLAPILEKLGEAREGLLGGPDPRGPRQGGDDNRPRGQRGGRKGEEAGKGDPRPPMPPEGGPPPPEGA